MNGIWWTICVKFYKSKQQQYFVVQDEGKHNETGWQKFWHIPSFKKCPEGLENQTKIQNLENYNI